MIFTLFLQLSSYSYYFRNLLKILYNLLDVDTTSGCQHPTKQIFIVKLYKDDYKFPTDAICSVFAY